MLMAHNAKPREMTTSPHYAQLSTVSESRNSTGTAMSFTSSQSLGRK